MLFLVVLLPVCNAGGGSDDVFALDEAIVLKIYTSPETIINPKLTQNGILIGLSGLIFRVTVFCIL